MAIWPHKIESMIISLDGRLEFVAVGDIVNVATGDPDHPTTTRTIAKIEPPDGHHEGWFVTVGARGDHLQWINENHVAQAKMYAVDPREKKETESS